VSAVKCSSPLSAHVNECCCTTSHPVCLHGVDRDNCSFLHKIVLKYLFLIWQARKDMQPHSPSVSMHETTQWSTASA
jgi:hypothetical protein